MVFFPTLDERGIDTVIHMVMFSMSQGYRLLVTGLV